MQRATRTLPILVLLYSTTCGNGENYVGSVRHDTADSQGPTDTGGIGGAASDGARDTSALDAPLVADVPLVFSPEVGGPVVDGAPDSGVRVPDDAVGAGKEAGTETGVSSETRDGDACVYPSTTRADDAGHSLYWWYFDWRQSDLASICASYGDGAKMVVELPGSAQGTPAGLPPCTVYEMMVGADHVCALADALRVETDCLDGERLFEAATENPGIGISVGFGYFHIESPTMPAPPRRLMIPDKTCYRALHPRFLPMVAAGSPDTGTDTGTVWVNAYDPSANGQPCHTNDDCRFDDQRCFIDATVASCTEGPIGRCVGFEASNCVVMPGCACLKVAGVICGNADPGTRCGGLATPDNPDLGQPSQGCSACIPVPDGGILWGP